MANYLGLGLSMCFECSWRFECIDPYVSNKGNGTFIFPVDITKGQDHERMNCYKPIEKDVSYKLTEDAIKQLKGAGLL